MDDMAFDRSDFEQTSRVGIFWKKQTTENKEPVQNTA